MMKKSESRMITIYGEKDYRNLHHLPFNRQYKVRQDLIESMNQYGFDTPIQIIETDIIDGSWKMYIADGQNRAATANFLKIPFDAYVVKMRFKNMSELVRYVSTHNATSKKWTDMDYINAYAYLQYPHYMTLNKCITESPFTPATVITLLQGIRQRSVKKAALHNGTFVVHHLEHFYYTKSLAAKISKMLKLNSTMIISMHYIASLKHFDEEKFIREFKRNYDYLDHKSLRDYSEIFESWMK